MDLPPLTSEQGKQYQLKDGRLLGYHVYGNPHGRPVLFFHGFPGSHEQALLVSELAAAAEIALVGFDRPGFGDSTTALNATIESVVEDAISLADHLGFAKFAAIGVSCGGPYTLAMARLYPDRVIGVGLLAGIGPMNRPEIREEQHPMLKVMFKLAGLTPWLIAPMLCADWLMFRLSPERAVRALAGMLTPPDRALIESDESVRRHFGVSLARAYVQGISAAMKEAARIARFNGGELPDIKAPVFVYQSGQDRNVPPAMGAYMAKLLPNAQLIDCPEDGHLSIVITRFSDCISRLHPEARHA